MNAAGNEGAKEGVERLDPAGERAVEELDRRWTCIRAAWHVD